MLCMYSIVHLCTCLIKYCGLPNTAMSLQYRILEIKVWYRSTLVLTLDLFGALLHTDLKCPSLLQLWQVDSLAGHWTWLWGPGFPHLPHNFFALSEGGWLFCTLGSLLCPICWLVPFTASICGAFLQQLPSKCWLPCLYTLTLTCKCYRSFKCELRLHLNFSGSLASWIPTTILSHIKLSCNSPYRAYKSVIKSFTDSVSPSHCLLNFVHSCIMFWRTVK